MLNFCQEMPPKDDGRLSGCSFLPKSREGNGCKPRYCAVGRLTSHNPASSHCAANTRWSRKQVAIEQAVQRQLLSELPLARRYTCRLLSRRRCKKRTRGSRRRQANSQFARTEHTGATERTYEDRYWQLVCPNSVDKTEKYPTIVTAPVSYRRRLTASPKQPAAHAHRWRALRKRSDC